MDAKSRTPGKFPFSGLPRQLQVQFLQQRVQPVAEEGMGAADAAALDEGCALEIGGFDADVAGDVVLDVLQPLPLIAGEGAAGDFLGHQPAPEPLLHLLAEGRKLVVVAEA